MMSTKSKLLAKTGDLQLPADGPAPSAAAVPQERASETAIRGSAQFPSVTPGGAPKTGPGQMLQFRGQMLAAESELTSLRNSLKEHDGSMPTRRLDPQSIVGSQWANRHPDSFKNAEFERLKQDIALAGGNVQPISVRPLKGQQGSYEVIFGHRRHRACSELGIPVLATIVASPVSELELFSAMDRENRERADLSPYEQGTMYRRAVEAGLYPSNRRLAEALGVSHTWVNKVLAVADLPAPILECFRTPIEVQFRHAKDIGTALEKDRKNLLRRAERLRQGPKRGSPAAVVAALIGSTTESSSQPTLAEGVFDIDGSRVGTWSTDSAGRLSIQIDAGVVSKDRLESVVERISQALRQ